MKVKKNYRDNLYDSYDSTHASHLYGESSIEKIRNQFPVWKNYFGRFLPLQKKAVIADIGCGDGGFVYWLHELGYKEACGIDRSPEQVEVANRLGIKNIKHAEFRDILDGQENVFDEIFARDVLEHFTKEEVFEIFNILNKSLKAGGSLIVQTPNGASPFSGSLRYGDFTHEIIFTQNSLNQVLRATGFTDIVCYSTGPVPKGLKSTVRFLLWKGIEMILKCYMVIEKGSASGIFTQNIIAVAKK